MPTDRPIDRLLKYLDSIGVKPYSFEMECEISNGYLNNQKIKKGQIGSEILDKIHSKHPDLNLIWVITGEEGMKVKKTDLPPSDSGITSNNSDQNSTLPHNVKGHLASKNASPTASPTVKKGTKKEGKQPSELPDNAMLVNEPGIEYTQQEINARNAAIVAHLEHIMHLLKLG